MVQSVPRELDRDGSKLMDAAQVLPEVFLKAQCSRLKATNVCCVAAPRLAWLCTSAMSISEYVSEDSCHSCCASTMPVLSICWGATMALFLGWSAVSSVYYGRSSLHEATYLWSTRCYSVDPLSLRLKANEMSSSANWKALETQLIPQCSQPLINGGAWVD